MATPSKKVETKAPPPLARHVEAIPPDATEAKVIEALQASLGDRMRTAGIAPSTIIRYVRGFAKCPDRIPDTIKYMDEFLKFRIESKVDELATANLPNVDLFNSMWLSGCHGVSKTGHVIYAQRLGKIEPDKLMAKFTFDQIRNFHIQEMEHLVAKKEALSAECGAMTYKHVCILDLEGIGMSHFGQGFRDPIKKVLHIDQFFYPETLHAMVITNAPFIFKAIWALVSPWIDPQTKARIQMGNDKLAQFIDPDQLPQFLGGKCKCANGKCFVAPFQGGKESAPKVERKAVPPPSTPTPSAPDAPIPASSSSSSSPASASPPSTASSTRAEGQAEGEGETSSSPSSSPSPPSSSGSGEEGAGAGAASASVSGVAVAVAVGAAVGAGASDGGASASPDSEDEDGVLVSLEGATPAPPGGAPTA